MKNNRKFRENSDPNPEPDLEVGSRSGYGSGQKSSGSATLSTTLIKGMLLAGAGARAILWWRLRLRFL